MIVGAQHGFGYVHAAKCGGSTIRAQLRRLAIDDFGGRFSRARRIEPWGKVSGNRLPLWVLLRHYREALAKQRDVTSYMLCRDPMDRFVSGMSQWFRSEKGRERADVAPRAAGAAAEEVIAALEADPTTQRRALVYFIPPVRYCDLDGARVVDHVIALETTGAPFGRLARDHGPALVRDSVWNPTVTYRFPKPRTPNRGVRKRARKLLPHRVYARLRDTAMRARTTPGAKGFEAALRDHGAVRDFVARTYAANAALHAASLVADRPLSAPIPTPEPRRSDAH